MTQTLTLKWCTPDQSTKRILFRAIKIKIRSITKNVIFYKKKFLLIITE